MSRLITAALVLLIAVGSLLGAAAWNRGGAPQFIVLTERELALPWSWENGSRDDDAADLRLTFRWQSRDDAQDARVWLSDTTLAALGFGTGLPPGAPGAEQVYGRSLPRLAWVAFEYDGPAWRLEEQRRAVANAEGHLAAVHRWSRLVPIDAGLDPAPLRLRHRGTSTVVMRAVVEMRYVADAKTGPSVWGWVPRLVPNDVAVPFHLRERLRGLRQPRSEAPSHEAQAAPVAPRYDVLLGVGRLGAVWIADLNVKN
jgi:hypothetical protein